MTKKDDTQIPLAKLKKDELVALVQKLEAEASANYGAPAHAVLDEDGNIQKIVVFDDPISEAVGEAIQDTVQHPTGDVNDAEYIPDWIDGITRKVSAATGVRSAFIRVSFEDTDRNGKPLEDDNWVRVYVKVGGQERNTLLVDPTPED